MTYLLVLLLPAVFFSLVGLVVHEVHALEARRALLAKNSPHLSLRRTA